MDFTFWLTEILMKTDSVNQKRLLICADGWFSVMYLNYEAITFKLGKHEEVNYGDYAG